MTLRKGLEWGLIIPFCFLLGCKTSPSQVISPRITGRVVDAQTQQPIKDVTVIRGDSVQRRKGQPTTHGAEALQPPDDAETDADGKFALKSIQSLTPFRVVGWYRVNVTFQHPDYQKITMSYGQTNA